MARKIYRYGSFGDKAQQFGKKVQSNIRNSKPITGAKNAKERFENGGVTNAEIYKQKELNAPDYVLERDSKEYGIIMDDFYDAIKSGQWDMYTDMAKNDNFMKEVSKEKLLQENRYYNYMMLRSCMIPLAQGIDSESVAQSLGMFMGIMIVSKPFREQTIHDFKQMRAEHKLKKAEKWDSRAMKLDFAASEFGNSKLGQALGLSGDSVREFLGTNKDSKYNPNEMNIARKWMNHCQEKTNKGQVPLNPDIYAMRIMSYQTQAYDMMRQPGANLEKIESDLQSAIFKLDNVAQEEGLFEGMGGKENALKHVRHVTQEMCHAHPELRKVFCETSYGDFEDENGVKRTVCSKDGNVKDAPMGLQSEYNEYKHNTRLHNFNENDESTHYYDGTVYTTHTSVVENKRTHQLEQQEVVEPMTGLFHVRRPMRHTDIVADKLKNRTDRMYDAVANAYATDDGIDKWEEMQSWYEKDVQLAEDMVSDDYGAVYVDNKTRKATSSKDAVDDLRTNIGNYQRQTVSEHQTGFQDYKKAMDEDTLDKMNPEEKASKKRSFDIISNIMRWRSEQAAREARKEREQPDFEKDGFSAGAQAGQDTGWDGTGDAPDDWDGFEA